MKKLFSLALVLALLCSAVCCAATPAQNANAFIDHMNNDLRPDESFVKFSIPVQDDGVNFYFSPADGGALAQVICGNTGVKSLRFVSRDMEKSFMCTFMLLLLTQEYFEFDMDDGVQWYDAGYKTIASKVTKPGDTELMAYELDGARLMMYGNYTDDGEIAYICSLECDTDLLPKW